MLPLGKQPLSRYNQQSDELTTQTSTPGAPSPAVNAILGRLGLARESDEPDGNEAGLARDLTDPSRTVRIEATQKLGKIGKQAPLELLVVALSDEQSSVRAAAARALGRNPRPAAISALVKALEDNTWIVRAEAALALGKMGEMAPLEPLLAATHDKEDPAVRAAAITALGEIEAESALELLKAALQDKDWLVRESATLALTRLKEQATPLPALTIHPHKDPVPRQNTEISRTQSNANGGDSSLPSPTSASLARWQERIGAFQAELTQSAEPTRWTDGPTCKEQKPASRASTSARQQRRWPASLSRSSRSIRIAEGLLALFLIIGLVGALLAITSQLHPTPTRTARQGPSPFTTYHGHMSSVIKALWSPDGQTIASADTRNTVHIWQANSGRTLLTYPQSGTVLALSWSNNSTLLVAYGEPNHSLQVEELSLGETSPIQIFFQRANLPGIPSVAAWSTNGQTLAFDTGDGSVQIWNTISDLNIANFQVQSARYSKLLWSPNTSQLATLTTSGRLQIWDEYSGQNVATLPGSQHATLIAWMASSQDSDSFFFATPDGTIMRWQYGQPGQVAVPFFTKQVYNAIGAQGLTLNALAVSPDGEQLLLATSDGSVQARDAITGNLIYVYQGHSAQVNDIEWTLDGQHIVTASRDTTAQIWQEP